LGQEGRGPYEASPTIFFGTKIVGGAGRVTHEHKKLHCGVEQEGEESQNRWV